jgi:hypothetical protein
MDVLFILIALVILLLLLRNMSSYTAAQAGSQDRYSQPILIGKTWGGQQNGWVNGDNFIQGSPADSSLSWDDLNIQMWTRAFTSSTGAARTCYGFRKTLQSGGGGGVLWLLRPLVGANDVPNATIFPNSLPDSDVLENVNIGGTMYAVPTQVTALKSKISPLAAADCAYTVSPGSACSATACGTSGTFTDTVTITTPKVAEGVCNYTNGAAITASGQTFNTRSCSAPRCQWVPSTYFTPVVASPPAGGGKVVLAVSPVDLMTGFGGGLIT